MDEHPAAPLDNSARQWDKMGHCRLNGIAYEHFSSLEATQVLGNLDTLYPARCQAWCSRLAYISISNSCPSTGSSQLLISHPFVHL
jgi:hypothetical protein